jgi:hypothetical protein
LLLSVKSWFRLMLGENPARCNAGAGGGDALGPSCRRLRSTPKPSLLQGIPGENPIFRLGDGGVGFDIVPLMKLEVLYIVKKFDQC